jgi:hypothetical protein
MAMFLSLSEARSYQQEQLKVAQTVGEKTYADMLQFFKKSITSWLIYTRAIILRKLLKETGQDTIASALLNFYNQEQWRYIYPYD